MMPGVVGKDIGFNEPLSFGISNNFEHLLLLLFYIHIYHDFPETIIFFGISLYTPP